MRTFLLSFLNDESGQTLTEYGLIIALVSALVLGSLVLFRNQLADLYSTVAGALAGEA